MKWTRASSYAHSISLLLQDCADFVVYCRKNVHSLAGVWDLLKVLGVERSKKTWKVSTAFCAVAWDQARFSGPIALVL
jgi:hypothetical protein